MELINGVNIVFLLLLALSSDLFSSANAICVPRNSSEFESPAASLVQPPAWPPQSTDSASAPESEDKGLNVQKSPSDIVSSAAAAAAEAAATFKSDLVEICDVTSNPQLCRNSIASNIEGPTVDPTSALKTEIDESIKVVEKAVTTLKALRKDTAASNVEIQCYDTCLENFDLAIFDLKAGLESIDAKDVGRMESVLTAVLSNLMTCDDTFEEMGVDSPLDNLSTKMSKYASNCLAISKLLL